LNNKQDIGPQYKRDAPFTAQMRFHQSWYRANVLKIPYGIGPQKNSKNKYGNMLTSKDGYQGSNFLTPEIFLLAEQRIAEKTGAVTEYRLLCNMLSSMPMCFNLFGPLKNDTKLASKLFGTMLPDEVAEVTNIIFEFNPSPRKDYLNDRTAFDIFVEFLTPKEKAAFIGIEVKLTEPFSQAKHENPSYDYWTNTDDSPWNPKYRELLIEKDVNQLWRNHLLVQSLLSVKGEKYSKGFFWRIYHKKDLECVHSLDKYFSFLNPDHNVKSFTLEAIREFWEPIFQQTDYQAWYDDFILRYLNLAARKNEFLKALRRK